MLSYNVWGLLGAEKNILTGRGSDLAGGALANLCRPARIAREDGHVAIALLAVARHTRR